MHKYLYKKALVEWLIYHEHLMLIKKKKCIRYSIEIYSSGGYYA